MSEPADLPSSSELSLAPGVTAPASALRMQFSRSGGPGGQHVNKTNSRAELWLFIPDLRGMHPAALARLRTLAGSRLTLADEIHIASETSRSQHANREDAMERLRELIVQACAIPAKRRESKPTRASKRRRLESKKHRAGIKSVRRHRDDE